MHTPLRLLAACLPTRLCALALGLAAVAAAPAAHAWGDEGHRIVALIADHYLSAPVRARVQGLLAQDTSGLSADTSMASEASWADHYRDSDRDTSRQRYQRTWRWHFVDLELEDPDLQRACFGRPGLPRGLPASQGPSRDCVVDKIDEFAAELADADTGPAERLLALQFLLHLVGDLHQPLHAADDHDAGGNRLRVRAAGRRPDSLHAYWDVVFVRDLGPQAPQVAADLIRRIRPTDLAAWRRGTPSDWALQSFGVARSVAYGPLAASSALSHGRGGQPLWLSPAYEQRSVEAVAMQLSRAGVRLALLLNRALQSPGQSRGAGFSSGPIRSSGSGNTISELFSLEMSASVCR